jgi:predicted transcriptional regulator YdeE
MFTLTEPRIIERGPYQVVGAYGVFTGDDEGPGWQSAERRFFPRKHEIVNRTDDCVLGFLYRPHRDHADVPQEVRACFIGVEVTDLAHAPGDMVTTQFSGGQYVIVESRGDTQEEAAAGVGAAIGLLTQWMSEHGYVEGDACFACSDEKAIRPPYVERVYIKIERNSGAPVTSAGAQE